jgi:hypothetical protein
VVAHYDELLRRFPDQYVAVFDEEVITSGRTLDGLSKNITMEAARIPKFDIRSVVVRRISTVSELFL